MGKLNLKSPKIKFIILLLVVLPILFFVMKTDFTEVIRSLKTVGFKFLYIIAVTFLAYFLGTLSWYVCLGKYRKNIPIFQLFAIRQVGETIGLYNPTSIVGGDFIKAQLLKRYQIPDDITINSVVTSRLTAILSQILLFILALSWLLFSPNKVFIIDLVGNSIYFILFILIALQLILVVWLIRSKTLFDLSKNSNNWIQKVTFQIKKALNNLKENIQNNPTSFWISYLYAALHWIVGSIEFYLILLFLGYDVLLMDGLLLDMSVIVLKSFGAFVPGQIGIEEFANKIVLTIIGISGGSIWITVSVLRRTRQLFWIFIGSILYAIIKKDLNYVIAQN